MRCRVIRSFKFTSYQEDDTTKEITIHAGLLGKVIGIREFDRVGLDGKVKHYKYYRVIFDGFINPHLNDFHCDARDVEVFDEGINKKGFKI